MDSGVLTIDIINLFIMSNKSLYYVYGSYCGEQWCSRVMDALKVRLMEHTVFKWRRHDKVLPERCPSCMTVHTWWLCNIKAWCFSPLGGLHARTISLNVIILLSDIQIYWWHQTIYQQGKYSVFKDGFVALWLMTLVNIMSTRLFLVA